ncbi:recombinase family protein [Brevibacterium casei]|nr:recombinase family protein [Brevibacterium casei]MCT1766894.1 recombinase family protein [Brevibacterium casei]
MMKIGYARCSTIQQDQDLTAQRTALAKLGVEADRVYTDVGKTGTNRDRPGLREALAALREGDILVVTKLDRLARSVRDAADIAAEVETRGAKLSLGGSVHDPSNPMGKLLFTVLSMVSEFEADLIRQRTREGMAVARARGHLRGKTPKLSPAQDRHVAALVAAGEPVGEVARLMNIGRATVYRAVERAKAKESAG